jgi:hypothetical protein
VAEVFAGARSLDERRRRRLASENGGQLDALFPTVSSTAYAQRPAGSEAGPASFPIERLISARKWKLIAFITGSILATVGLAWLGMSPAILESVPGDRFSTIFQLPNGSAFSYFSSFLLIGAAQLSFTIGWVRSRNQHDFGGNYRIWRWAAGLFLGASVFVSTGFHLAVADIVTHYVTVRYPYRDVLNWLVPVSVISVPIVLKVIHDMSNCRLSTALFSMTAVVAYAVAMTPFVERWDTAPSALVVARMAVCCLLFCSLLIHTWYVVHVSSEPPGALLIRQPGMISDDRPHEIDSTNDRSLEAAAVAATPERLDPAAETPQPETTSTNPPKTSVKGRRKPRRSKPKKSKPARNS